MKKIVLSALIVGLAMVVVGAMLGFIFNIVFSPLKAEYSNENLFRPFSDPSFLSIYLIQPFIVAVLLSWLWSKVNMLLKEKNSGKKGLHFGFVYWLVTLPGLMLAYASSPYSLLMVGSWGVIGLTQALCAGLLISKINK